MTRARSMVRLSSAAAVAAALAGCIGASGGPPVIPAAAPRVTGAERQDGREHAQLVAAFGGEYRAPKAKALLTDIADRLVPATDRPEERYEITILDSPVINAFALPNGRLYVTRGLLALANDTAEIAAVLAHEIAHVTIRHANARTELELRSALVSRVVADVLGNPSAGATVLDRSRVTINLRAAPYGYLVVWENNALVLKIRGRPAIDANRPLAGLTIAVDPGHPPIGATGPTGLWEPVAALAVSERLRDMLRARGARVVMARTTPDAVALSPRSTVARRENAHALISIHLNAFGEGTNPFANNGTSTLFYHPQSEPLARLVQRGMIASMGLRDLGVHYQNIAIGRTSWMPALITEGLFLMVPEQEHAMRTPEGQEAYARGVAWGVEEYFRTMDRR